MQALERQPKYHTNTIVFQYSFHKDVLDGLAVWREVTKEVNQIKGGNYDKNQSMPHWHSLGMTSILNMHQCTQIPAQGTIFHWHWWKIGGEVEPYIEGKE